VIANYGYQDAEGAFYITINTGPCAGCTERPCIPACPASLFVEEEDPYGDAAVAIDEGKRRKLKYACAGCKPSRDRPPLPCTIACPFGAIRHSW